MNLLLTAKRIPFVILTHTSPAGGLKAPALIKSQMAAVQVQTKVSRFSKPFE